MSFCLILLIDDLVGPISALDRGAITRVYQERIFPALDTLISRYEPAFETVRTIAEMRAEASNAAQRVAQEAI